MSIIDFFRLLRRYLALVIVISLVCATSAACFTRFDNKSVSYSATSYVVTATSSQLASLTGAASAAARDFASKNPGYSAGANSDTSTLTVVITAKGPDSDTVIKAVNSIAESTADGAKSLLKEDAVVNVKVQKATKSTKSGGEDRSLALYAIVGLIAGLIVSICIVLIIDAVRRPVKSTNDLASASRLPVIGELPRDPAERLLANVRFASGGSVGDLLALPVQNGNAASLVGMIVERAASTDSSDEMGESRGPTHVSISEPLLQDISAAYRACEADATLIVCAQWSDSRNDVEATAAELQLAGANVIGCVLVSSKFLKKNGGHVQ